MREPEPPTRRPAGWSATMKAGRVIGDDQLDDLDEEPAALTTVTTTTDPSPAASHHIRQQPNRMIAAPTGTAPVWSAR